MMRVRASLCFARERESEAHARIAPAFGLDLRTPPRSPRLFLKAALASGTRTKCA